MSYQRVIPRDLFNEGDLLNCLGRLWIKLDERRGHSARLFGPCFPARGFEIEQDESDGSIEATSLTFRISDFVAPRLFRPLNARDKWPLYARLRDEDVRVFDEAGDLTPEFWEMIREGR